MASRWRHCADLTGPGIEPQTSRTDSVRLATELTAGSSFFQLLLLYLHVITLIVLLPLPFYCTIVIFPSSYGVDGQKKKKDTAATTILIDIVFTRLLS